MDYSESLIWIRAFTRSTEELLNKSNLQEALEKAEHISAEAKQLEETIQLMIKAREEV